jgi:hypothetical protein
MEVKFFILLAMVFCHIIDDYNLQGWLASAKQKVYWEQNAPDPMYKRDYIMALIMHSISWSFMMMLPVMVYQMHNGHSLVMAFIFFVINTILHIQIDDMKANRKQINLVQDQLLHLLQIVLTWLVIIVF